MRYFSKNEFIEDIRKEYDNLGDLVAGLDARRMTEAGTWPTRKPGRRAIFWYFCTKVSVSRVTSSAGISISNSRLVDWLVSVGITIPRVNGNGRAGQARRNRRVAQTTATP